MSRHYTSAHIRAAQVIFFLVKAPRTQGELRELMGMPDNTTSLTTISRVLRALRDEGLVDVCGVRPLAPGTRGLSPRLWAWVALPGGPQG